MNRESEGGCAVADVRLAPHELMELHELMNLKTLTLFKTKMVQGIVFDKDLKAMLHKYEKLNLESLEQLGALYPKAPVHIQ